AWWARQRTHPPWRHMRSAECDAGRSWCSPSSWFLARPVTQHGTGGDVILRPQYALHPVRCEQRGLVVVVGRGRVGTLPVRKDRGRTRHIGEFVREHPPVTAIHYTTPVIAGREVEDAEAAERAAAPADGCVNVTATHTVHVPPRNIPAAEASRRFRNHPLERLDGALRIHKSAWCGKRLSLVPFDRMQILASHQLALAV